MIPAPDIVVGLTGWDITFTMDRLSEARKNLIGDAFLNNYILEFGLIIAYFTLNKRYIKKNKSFLISFGYAFIIILLGFLSIALLKYSLLRHHLLLSFVIIFLLLSLIKRNQEHLQKNKLFLLLLLPLLVLSIIQFQESSIEYKFELRSNSKNAAEFLDKYCPDRDVLVMSEMCAMPIRLYRRFPDPLYSIARQEYVEYTIWNDLSVDYRRNKNVLKPRLSEVINKLENTPQHILYEEPVLVIASLTTLWEMDDIRLPLSQVKIQRKFHLEFIKAFTGAQEENYYLYIIKPINEEG